jgi:methylated-DNA-[protein]-cysteine S-methyltransferase
MKQTKRSESGTSFSIRTASPVGELIIHSNGRAICAITNAQPEDQAVPTETPNHPELTQAVLELSEYFAGKRTAFTFPMEPEGTPFQKSVWDALLKIPYGKTATYGQIAMAVGNPKGARAVGMACNKNPIWIVVPCHRVIGSNGSLTGYALGTGMKEQLLKLEGAIEK